MMLSVYDTVVLDRGLVSPRSPLARLARGVDRWAVRASDLALLDTPQQVDFCIRELGIPAAKLAAVPVGAETAQFPPTPLPRQDAPGEPLRVLLYSSFIPLHGTLTVAAAIRLLTTEAATTDAARTRTGATSSSRPIRFTIVGQGQDRAGFDQAVGAVNDGVAAAGPGPGRDVEAEVLDWVPYDQLGDLVAAHHVLLGVFGVFGQSEKASRVVPNKVYQAACAARAVVTADSPAMRAAFTSQEIVLVPPGDPAALVAALCALAADPGRVACLGRRARRRFEADYAPEAIGPGLAALLRALQSTRQAVPQHAGSRAVNLDDGARRA